MIFTQIALMARIDSRLKNATVLFFMLCMAAMALSACNFSGNLGLALGGARITGAEHTQTTTVMQGKTSFRPLEKNDWGVGLVLGNQFNPDKSALGDLYANVPLSFSFKDDRVLLHLNLGWLHEKEMRRHAITWGVATELQFAERTSFSAET